MTEASKSWREEKWFLLIVITLALFIQEMLVSIIVPIIPTFLHEIQQKSTYGDNKNFMMNITTSNNSEYIRSIDETNLNNAEKKNNFTNNENPLTIGEKNASNFESDNFKNGNDIKQNGVKIGILLGAKSFVQMLANFFVGPITQRIDYGKPMFFGFIVLFFSCLVFIFGTTYEMLLFARAFQGIGSSCTSIAGKSALSSRYINLVERDNALRIAVGGSLMGLMCGPPCGALLYQYVGKSSPFFILCGLTLVNGVIQLLIKPLKKDKSKTIINGPSILTLIQDPYILLVALGLFLIRVEYALLETCLPVWMIDTMKPTQSALGTVFVPTTVGLLSVFLILGKFCLKMGRWLMTMLGMLIVTISLVTITFTKSVIHLFIPNCAVGLALGMSNAALTPELTYIVDIRYTSVYGNAFAITDFFQECGLAIGPICSGYLLRYAGFYWVMYCGGILSLIYSLMAYLLKNPPTKNTKSQLFEEKTTNELLISS